MLACFAVVLGSAQVRASVTRVSVAGDGTQGNNESGFVSADASPPRLAISADGRYVAFTSAASNLVPVDGNYAADVFVYDRQTGWTERVSVGLGGMPSDGPSSYPSISADGRYVAFNSAATNLVLNDTNDTGDVFVHDRETGATELVSGGTAGMPFGTVDSCCAISGDGQKVAFESGGQLFVYDRATSQTTKVSVAPDGTTAGNGTSYFPSLSLDGRYLVFASAADNLVPGDTYGAWDIFVRDLQVGFTRRVSVASDGTQAHENCYFPAISADGRYAAFSSPANNLVPGDTNGAYDIFVHDLETGVTDRVSVASDGTQANGYSGDAALSADGRYVSFTSDASNLVAGGTNGERGSFVYDRQTGLTWRASLGSGGAEPNNISWCAVLDADANCAAFISWATNLVTGDTNGVWDVFVSERPVAEFSADVTTGPAPLTVAFTDLSTGGPTEWLWDFGDGTPTSAEQNPSHEYAGGGTYTVTLTVTDGIFDPNTITKTDDVTVFVPGDPPVADFSATPSSGLAPLEVTFSDLSTNTPTEWAWDFGDGATATAQHPTHTYAEAGSYTVSLVATNQWGFDIETKTGCILVSAPVPPAAAFSGTPTIGYAPLAVTFTDASTGDTASWLWDFGDGTTSADQNPSHSFAVGAHAVSLTVTGPAGTDSEEKAHYILATFPDVPYDPEHWALHQILACVEAGVVQGYPSGKYQPEWTVTRGQMAIYIARALAGGDALVPTGPEEPAFGDVGTDHWAYKYIEYCVDNDIVVGYWDGYRPDEVVNRGQMAVYIARAIATPTGDAGVPPATTVTFTDVTADNGWAWCYKYVEYCAGLDIVQGYWDGYHPEREVTRDQMAVYVARAFELNY